MRSSVRSGLAGARKCYDALLAKDPSASGSVSMEFSVEGDGTVTGARTADGQSTLKDGDLGACLIDAVTHITFPKSGERTTVRYPFTFKPSTK